MYGRRQVLGKGLLEASDHLEPSLSGATEEGFSLGIEGCHDTLGQSHASNALIAVEDAEFFVPEATLGIIPDSGGVLRLPRRLPKSIAMELLMTGRRMGVSEAKKYGLVNKSCSVETLRDDAIEWARKIAKSAPLSLAAIKSVIRETEAMDVETANDFMRSGGIDDYNKMLKSEDAKEGTNAFSEKRNPEWKGI